MTYPFLIPSPVHYDSNFYDLHHPSSPIAFLMPIGILASILLPNDPVPSVLFFLSWIS